MDTLNEEVVSLYNFEKTFRLDTAVDKPCARYAQPGARPLPQLTLPSADPVTSDRQLQVNWGPVAHRRLLPGRLWLCPHQRGESDQPHQAL